MSSRAITTEEGQRVLFDPFTFATRELAKVLPLGRPWPHPEQLVRTCHSFGIAIPLAPAIPIELVRGVHVVGQRRTDNLTYLIETGDAGFALIDPGYDAFFEETVSAILAVRGAKAGDVRWVLNTHCHADHSMANHRFAALGAQVMIHEADARAIERGTPETTYEPLEAGQFGGVAPPAFPATSDVERLHDGQVLHLGDIDLTVVHTPGHTAGSASFAMRVDDRDVLFSGDTVLYDHRLGWQDPIFADDHAYVRSLRRLTEYPSADAAIAWDMLLPGHGAVSLDQAHLDTAKAIRWATERLELGGDMLAWPDPGEDYRRLMLGQPLVHLET